MNGETNQMGKIKMISILKMLIYNDYKYWSFACRICRMIEEILVKN